jgi:hypothetical protein
MSTRYNNGSHYENHQRAAELHDLAAHAHRTAAESHDKQDHETGHERSRQALEYSQRAFENAAVARPETVNEHGFAAFGHAEIAALALKIWQAKGCPEGSAEQDWLQAAQELRARREEQPNRTHSREDRKP